jgi:hypothetical protein
MPRSSCRVHVDSRDVNNRVAPLIGLIVSRDQLQPVGLVVNGFSQRALAHGSSLHQRADNDNFDWDRLLKCNYPRLVPQSVESLNHSVYALPLLNIPCQRTDGKRRLTQSLVIERKPQGHCQ